jgi:hypothetical protein
MASMTPDRAAGLAGVTLSAAVVMASIGLGIGRPTDPGAGSFPALAGAALAVTSAMLAHRSGRAGSPDAARVARAPLVFVVTMVVYALLFERLGHALATLVIAVALLRSQRVAWRGALVAAAVIAATTDLVFVTLLDVELPGFLDRIL